MFPLDSYHVCLADLGRASVIAEVCLALVFGKHFVTLPNPPPIPRVGPPTRHLRHHSFRVRHRASAVHQIDTPWNGCAEYPQYSQQGL